jgi:ATP-dependent DNA helicase RecG
MQSSLSSSEMVAWLLSYERSTETDVILVLPGEKANQDFVRMVVEENQAGRPFRLDDLLLLNHMYLERRTTAKEAAKIIQKPENEARAALERLVEGGLLDASGEGRARAYHLCASTYRRLGERAAYIRAHGFEPLQWEQMVLQYVEKHGEISRAEVAQLCNISGLQAYRLLKKLEGKGTSFRLGQRDEA